MLRVHVQRVDTVFHGNDYGFGGSRNYAVEVSGQVLFPFDNGDLAALTRDRGVLVPEGSVLAEADTRWLKAMAAVLTADEMRRVLVEFERQTGAKPDGAFRGTAYGPVA